MEALPNMELFLEHATTDTQPDDTKISSWQVSELYEEGKEIARGIEVAAKRPGQEVENSKAATRKNLRIEAA